MILAAAMIAAVPATALAFHAGSTFDKAPGAGGAGGLFYTGAPRERGWDCTACHTEAPGRLRVTWASEPAELLSARRWIPGTSYDITVRMGEERLGLGAGRSNFNGFALTVMDEEGRLAGALGGYSAETFYARGQAIIASSGTAVGETEWHFRWTAPEAGHGAITFYAAVVDGDGAGSPPDETLTDPFGDDVAVGTVTAFEAPGL